MKLSTAEKLQLMMLCDIYREQEIDGEFDPDLISEAITSGNTWAITDKYQFLEWAEDVSEDQVKFVYKVLTMYSVLDNSYKQLSTDDTKRLLVEIKAYGKSSPTAFPGFDGNEETDYYSITGMMEKMGKYKFMEDIDKNSHSPMSSTYYEMLLTYEPLFSRAAFGNGLGYEDLKTVLSIRYN